MFPEPYALQPQRESNGEIRPVDTPVDTDAPAPEVQEKPSLPVSVSSESDSWHIQPPQPGVFALLALVCWPILVRQRKDLPATWYW